MRSSPPRPAATATATATTTTTTYRIGPDGKKHVVDTTTTTTTTAGGVGKSTKQQTTTTKTQMMSRNPALDRVQAGLRREQQRAAAAKLERVQQDEHKGRGGIVAAEARVRSRLVSGEREIATKLIAALRRREAAGGDELQWHVRNAKATSSSTASIAASAPKFAALRAVWNAAAGNGDGAMKFSAVAAACEAAGFLRVSVVTTTEMSPANGVATNNTAGAAAVAASAPASEAYSSDLDDDDARSLPSPSPEPAAASSVAASSIPPTPSPVATRSPTPASVGPKSTPPRSPTASLPATPRSEIDGASVPATPASSIPPTPVSSAAPGTRSPLPLRSSPPRSPRSPTPASDAEAGYSDDDFEEAASPASASPPPPPPPKPEEHPPEGAASAVALQDLADPDEVRRRVEAEEAERAAREAAERARKAALVAPASDEVRPVAPVEGSEAVLEAAVLVVSIETADAIRKLAACIDELAVGAAAVTIDAEAEEQLRAAVSTTLGPLEPPGTDFVDAVVALLAALASLRCSGNPAAPSPIAEWCADDEWLDASLLNEQATSADARPLATVLRLISGATDVHRSATTEWGAALARRLANAPVHAESAAGGANRDAVRALLLGVPSPCAVVGSAVWNDDTASAWIAAARRLALAVPHTTDAERCTVCAACTTLRQRLGAAHHDEWNSQLCGANGHADIK
uniref:Uncharacterized protein n=1 Tax=Neobodo designis TaxID=312471 RepID=A0A7S1R4J4_NEODS|mmetsp:Transcript_8041/g.25064  ORF Transcript_8041/g.25064 Transcript_8041/m.25064 type:complete len:691 (+) Transcript_8041:217-2289(+)